jgi:hypothetical protein
MTFGSRAPLSPLRVVLLAQLAQMGSSATDLLRHKDRSSPAILVRHSYGGSLITAAGVALAPRANETSQSRQAQFPITDISSHIDVADGRVWLKPKSVACFAGGRA